MKALRIPYFASSDDILAIARAKFGKHKKFRFVRWPVDGSVRLVIDNGTCNASQEDNDVL